jgi:hypothetical protein
VAPKAVFDVIPAAPDDKPNPGLEAVARLLKLYGAASEDRAFPLASNNWQLPHNAFNNTFATRFNPLLAFPTNC